MNQAWLFPNCLQLFANVIYPKGAPLDNCWGFTDGTVRPCCRPGINQRIGCNGHKRVHGIKFQSVVTPNGLIAKLFGPVEGRKHGMWNVRVIWSMYSTTTICTWSKSQHSLSACGSSLPLESKVIRSFKGCWSYTNSTRVESSHEQS